MKRLVTLGITLALVMGLFCFSVNATNIVIQGESDTVTTTYGDNDVTIALRARKLRVINTGTAAAGYAGYTPVIVSITIYNLGNQNCLVNNLKFRLTSESAEYRIAGYENISPDLFISDTAYDTTGYLSLKAANEYTYSGGFVVPANSNMTYVGIINVSANWITENQTWRTVDLSTATFYDNLTTTVGDYTCNAEPVDLTSIEDSLDDIVQSLQGIDIDSSTYLPLLESILNNLTYTGSAPVDININARATNFSQSNFLINNHSLLINRYIGAPYYSERVVIENNSADTLIDYGTIKYPFTIYMRSNNNSGYPIKQGYYNLIRDILPTSVGRNIYITYFCSDLYNSFKFTNEGHLYLYCKQLVDTYNGVLPIGASFTVINGYIEVNAGTSVTFNNFDTSSYSTPMSYLTDGYYPRDEFTVLRDLYIAYSSVNGIDDLSDAASDASDQAAAIHNQEASYYAQNQAAIEATGLTNYQFSGEQTNGIGAVSNDFTALWNALGSWNSVSIFSMTLSMALTILRHAPNRRKPKEKNSE